MPFDFFSQFSGVGSGFVTGLKSLIYIIPIFLIAAAIIMIIRNRGLYRFKVRIFRIRESGKVKEFNYSGAFITRQNSSPYFRIKTGIFPNQGIDQITTPEVKFMDEEDRVYYLQTDVSTFIQLKRDMDLVKEVIRDKNGEITKTVLNKTTFSFEPVESDIRYGAILATQRVKQIMAVEPTWKKVLPYFGITILAVVFIVAYALLLQNT